VTWSRDEKRLFKLKHEGHTARAAFQASYPPPSRATVGASAETIHHDKRRWRGRKRLKFSLGGAFESIRNKSVNLGEHVSWLPPPECIHNARSTHTTMHSSTQNWKVSTEKRSNAKKRALKRCARITRKHITLDVGVQYFLCVGRSRAHDRKIVLTKERVTFDYFVVSFRIFDVKTLKLAPSTLTRLWTSFCWSGTGAEIVHFSNGWFNMTTLVFVRA